VYETIQPPSIAPLPPVCHGSTAFLGLNQGAFPTGLTWQYEWFDENGVPLGEGVTIETSALTAELIFYVQATSAAGCGSTNSLLTQLDVFPPLQPPVLSSSDSEIPEVSCYGAGFHIGVETEPAPGMDFSYQWFINGAPVDPMEGGNDAHISVPSLTEDLTFELIATSLLGCGQTSSNPWIQLVFPELQPAFIGTNNPTVPDTLCYGTSGFSVQSLSEPPLGMTFSYLWFVDGVLYTESALGELELPTMEASTDIQLEIVSLNGCGNRLSNVWHQPVFEQISPPIIVFEGYDSHDTLCYGSDGPVILVETSTPEGMSFGFDWYSATQGSQPVVYPFGSPNELDVQVLTETTSFHLQAVSLNGCGTYVSSSLEVPVFPEPSSPTIAFVDAESAAPICYGEVIPTLFMSQAPALGMEFSWQWVLNGSSIPNGTSPTLANLPLQSSSQFVLTATSTNGCGTWNSNTISVEVLPELQAGFASALPDLICFDTPASLQTTNATGGDGNFQIQWLAGLSPETLAPINGADQLTWITSDLTQSIWVSPLFTSLYGCGQIAGNVLQIQVLPDVVPGVLSPSDSICYNSTPSPLIVSNATGADGVFETAWFAWNGQDWLGVQSGGIMHAPGTLNQSTLYRCDFISQYGCGTYSSNEVEVYVFEELIPGNILSFDTPLCNGFTTQFEATNEVSGENILYQWEASEDGNLWSAIPNSTSLLLTTGELSEDTFFRMRYTSANGCGTATTPSVILEIYPALAPAAISSFGNESPFCFGAQGPSLQTAAPPSGGNGSFYSFWQFSSNGVSWSTVSNLMNWTPASLTQTGQFRLVSISTAGCGAQFSNLIPVSVLPAVVPSTISSAQSICYLEPGNDLIGTPTTGADGIFSYQWLVNTPVGYTPIPGETATQLAINGLTETTTFALQSTSTYGCGTVQSNPVEVFVWDELIPGSLLNTPDTACFGWNISLGASPVVSGQNMSVQWHLGNDGGQLNIAPVGANSLSLLLDDLYETTYFAISYTSNNGCGTVWSDTNFIMVLPPVTPPLIELTSDGLDSLCNGATPDLILQINESSGGSSSFSYDWQFQNASLPTWSDLGESADYLSLPPQTQSFSIRQKTTDALCGPFYSNELDFTVFEPFQPAGISEDQTICYGTTPEILTAIGPYGGGEQYTYAWFAFNGSDTIGIPDTNAPSLVLSNAYQDETYLLFTSSDFGCGFGWSEATYLQVADPLVPGSFSVNPEGEICSGEWVSAEGMDATGGLGTNQFNWWIGDNGNWGPVGTNSINLENIQLMDTVQLSLTYSNLCGTVSADTVTIHVNPLPTIPNLSGQINPCTPSFANYISVGSYQPELIYNWSTTSTGVNISSGETGPAVLFDYEGGSSFIEVNLDLEYLATGCSQDSTFTLLPNANSAPPAGFVEQKPGLDVLVCSDSSDCAQYQWGIFYPSNNQIAWLPGENAQFLYFEDLANEPGIFCVEVIYDCGEGDASCPTLMYWNYNPFLLTEAYNPSGIKIYPNPFSAEINCTSNATGDWKLYDLSGRVIAVYQGGGSTWLVPDHLSRGIYVLTIELEEQLIQQIVIHE
jgi:hypothetical protein